MADMLKFKRGLFANLPSAKDPGTIYITTDEKAMYLDTSDTERIRISSSIIQYDSIGDPRIEPPFSTEALYYFIAENALMKWDGTAWKQLNSVSDITTNINNLQNDVASLKTKVGEAKKTVEGLEVPASGLFKDIADLQTKDTDLQSQISANKLNIESNDTDIADLTKRMDAAEEITGTVGDIKSTADKNKTDIENLTKTVGEHTIAISKNTTAIGDTETEGSLIYRVGAIETNVNELTGAIGADATAGTVKGRIKTLEDDFAKQKTTVEDHEDAISKLQAAVGEDAEGLSGKLTTLTGRVDTAEGKISALEIRAGQIESKDSEQDKTIADLNETAAGNKTAIETLNGDSNTAGSVDYKIAAAKTALESADSNLNNRIDSVSDIANQNKTDIGTLTSDLETTNGEVSKNKTAIELLNDPDVNKEGSIANKINTAKTELSEEIGRNINAANAMNYVGDITSLDNLPSGNVHIGDTYVVTEKFEYNDISYNAGDMLIAKGEEDATSGVITSSSLEWDHVKTGYDATNEAILSGDAENNAINLTSHISNVTGDLGKITFEDGGSGIKTAIASNKVTLSIEWGTF